MNVLYPDLQFGPLDPLGSVRWLVIHTAAGNPDATAEDVHRWHKERGWSGIGYHYYIRPDGLIERGRAERWKGAHARGLNHSSIGVCCAGHGDEADFTGPQKRALASLLPDLRARHGVPKDRVIGHREVHTKAGAPDPGKTCPGTKVDMSEVRALSDGAALYDPDPEPRPPEVVQPEVPIPLVEMDLTPREARLVMAEAMTSALADDGGGEDRICAALDAAIRHQAILLGIARIVRADAVIRLAIDAAEIAREARCKAA